MLQYGMFQYKASGHVATSLKPGLHIVITTGEHAYEYDPKRILKLSAYRLEVSLVKGIVCDHYSYTKTQDILVQL